MSTVSWLSFSYGVLFFRIASLSCTFLAVVIYPPADSTPVGRKKSFPPGCPLPSRAIPVLCKAPSPHRPPCREPDTNALTGNGHRAERDRGPRRGEELSALVCSLSSACRWRPDRRR